MKFSIIIPVYNAEKYLSSCLDSIISSLGKFKGEILIIDNNSTDNSLKIARKYQKKHQNFIHIHKCPTWGAAAARNYGVDKATGEYIWFIDADDYISKTAFKELSKSITKDKPDLIMFGAERIYQDGHKDYLSPVSPDEPNFRSRFVRYGMGPWQILIRQKWWQEHGYQFKEGIIHEDMELMSALILNVKNYSSIKHPLYFYNQTPDSVLHQQSFNPHIFDIFPALNGLYQRFESAGATSKYYSELEWFFIWNLLIDSAKDFEKYEKANIGFRKTREFLKTYFPNWYRNKFLKEKPLKLRLKVYYNYFRNK